MIGMLHKSSWGALSWLILQDGDHRAEHRHGMEWLEGRREGEAQISSPLGAYPNRKLRGQTPLLLGFEMSRALFFIVNWNL